MKFSRKIIGSTLPFIFRQSLLAASFILFLSEVNAQCVNEVQLIYATDCKIDELRTFFHESSWSNFSIKDSAQIQLGEMILDVKELQWSRYDERIKVLIPHEDPSVRIIAYIPTISCFSNLYRDAPEETSTLSNNGYSESLIYERNSVEIQLNSDYSNNSRLVLIYKKEEIYNIIQKQQLVIAARQRADDQRNQQIYDYLNVIQSYIENQEYSDALNHLSSNVEYLGLDSINVLYKTTINNFNTSALNEFEILVDLEKFEDAITFGSSVLASDHVLNPTKEKLKNGIKEIKETLEFLKTIETNVYLPERFGIRKDLEENIRYQLEKFMASSPESGQLFVQINWRSNYLGENKSEVQVSEPTLKAALQSELLKQDLPKIGKYFVNTKASFEYELAWESRRVKAIKNQDIQFSKSFGNDEPFIRNWLDLKNKGKYTFNVTRTAINDREIYRVVFEKYVNTNIAPALAKGYILPASGKPSLTKGRFNQSPADNYVRNLFWLTTITALTCEGLSQVIYQTYIDDPTDITAYDDANILHQASLISAGVAVMSYMVGIQEAKKEAKSQRSEENSFNKANRNVTIYQGK